MHCARCLLAKRSTHFNSNDELFLHNQISHVFAHVLPLVANRKRNLSLGAYTAQGQLPDPGALINFLQKSRSQNIGNLEGGANHRLRQIRFASVSIRVHPWPLSNRFSEGSETLTKKAQNFGHGWTRMDTDSKCLANSHYTSLGAVPR